MKKSISIITLLFISQNLIAQDSVFIPTAYGTFTECQQAIAFRDNQLLKFYDKAFVGANDSEKVARYNSTLADFELHKEAAFLALKTAGREQRQEIMKTIAMSLAFKKLGKVSNYKKYFPNLSEDELKTVIYLTKRAAKVSQLAIESGFQDKSQMEKFIKGELLNNAKFISGFANISPQTKLFITGVELGINVGFTYWDGEDSTRDTVKIYFELLTGARLAGCLAR